MKKNYPGFPASLEVVDVVVFGSTPPRPEETVLLTVCPKILVPVAAVEVEAVPKPNPTSPVDDVVVAVLNLRPKPNPPPDVVTANIHNYIKINSTSLFLFT